MADNKPQIQDEDERKLAELGYKQELGRSWSGFANFAISFSIISVLSGCFTNFQLGWTNGGPIVFSWGWPIVALLILTVAFSMSELASAYPTAGGPYWWASKLGGPGWAWYTGWFNVIGLIAVVGSVTYGAALFAATLFGSWGVDLGFISFVVDDANPNLLQETFALFFVFLILLSLINIFSSHLVAFLSSVSVWWHVFGVAVVIAILIFVPDSHQSADFVFTERLSLAGFGDGAYWLLVLPLGLMYVVMYTITGYDASAHVAEETQSAEMAAARGIWQSVAYSAVIGWFLLLAFVFAASDEETVNAAFGFVPVVFFSAMPNDKFMAELILLISVVGQLFCGMACITSCSRTLFAFSRDRAVPGHKMLSKVDKNAVPRNAVIWSCLIALAISVPALYDPLGIGAPSAFFAVVSIAVVGLYIAYVTPVYLRLRAGDAFKPGSWTLGKKYKWVNSIAVIWVVISVIYFCMPTSTGGIPGNDAYNVWFINYAPIILGAITIAITIWWFASAKKSFTGPVRTIEFDEALRVIGETETETTTS
jgi:amino acid transporter